VDLSLWCAAAACVVRMCVRSGFKCIEFVCVAHARSPQKTLFMPNSEARGEVEVTGDRACYACPFLSIGRSYYTNLLPSTFCSWHKLGEE